MSNRLVMWDDVDVSKLPPADLYAGYLNGAYANYSAIIHAHPNARVISIDVNGMRSDANALDIEKGDARITYAPTWFGDWHKHPIASAIGKPIFYTSASDVSALNAVLARAGIQRDQYYVWSAHYTGKPHICGPIPCGYPVADMTQWTDKALNRSLDESLVSDYVLGTVKPAAPAPTHNITEAIAALDAYDSALAKVHNAPGVNRRIGYMRKSLGRQRAYLASKDVK